MGSTFVEGSGIINRASQSARNTHRNAAHNGAPSTAPPHPGAVQLGAMKTEASKKNGFISHLLGIDYAAGGHFHGHAQPQTRRPNAPSQLSTWLSAVRTINYAKALDGVSVSTNLLFLMLFTLFFAWLFVVYWLRHHDTVTKPPLNQVHVSSKMLTDQSLMSRAKAAIPYRGIPNTESSADANAGSLPPAAPPLTSSLQSRTSYSPSAYPVLSEAGAASAARPGYNPALDVDPRFGTPVDPAGSAASFGSSNVGQPIYTTLTPAKAVIQPPQSDNQAVAAPPANQGPVTFGQSDDGSRLKMFVNR